MLAWKRDKDGSTALMIKGARRVGKSTIAEEFAKNEYPAYLLIDFATVSAKVKRYFNEYLENLDSFFLYLLSAYDVELPRGSLIIFDDVKTDKGVLYLPLYMAQLLVASCHDNP